MSLINNPTFKAVQITLNDNRVRLRYWLISNSLVINTILIFTESSFAIDIIVILLLFLIDAIILGFGGSTTFSSNIDIIVVLFFLTNSKAVLIKSAYYFIFHTE